MAKEQNVFLNPAKISGICGRLLCCLAYEQENYDEFYRRCPKLGKKYQTTRGVLRVLRASMFRESVNVLTETNEELEFTLEEWQALEPTRPEGGVPQQLQQPQQQSRPERDRGQSRDRPPRPQRPERENDVPSEEGQEQKSASDGRSSRGGPRPQNRQESRPPRQREERADRAPDRKSSDKAVADQPAVPRVHDAATAPRPQAERKHTAPATPAARRDDAAASGGKDQDTGDGSIFGFAPRRRGEEHSGAKPRDGGDE